MAEKPADEAKDVHDNPDKGDSESTEETLERHEALHHEHRGRIDALEKHLGMGEPGDNVRGARDEPNRSDSIRQRRRHD